MMSHRVAIVLEDMVTKPIERNGLQVSGRNDAVGVYVVATERNRGAGNPVDR